MTLNPDGKKQVHELIRQIRRADTLLHDRGRRAKIKPALRVLFHGPPGTGKMLTASLVGKETGRSVYRIDLSAVTSKYIGETEKNLLELVERADSQDWILFFDEADALFGKRTSVKDAHDRYANQEVSYFLQRMEKYDGVVILSANLKANVDEVFLKRLNTIIEFPSLGRIDKKRLQKHSGPNRFER